jgi:hypothetical protein
MPRWRKCRMFRLTTMTSFDFNSARLVRKGEELEHFHPEMEKPERPATGQLTPKLA